MDPPYQDSILMEKTGFYANKNLYGIVSAWGLKK
jgi:hypothetical protein